MKKYMCGILVGVMVLAFAPTAFAKSKITVNVDKEELVFDVEPQIINDRLMVPMRVIFEKLNANVVYIASEKAVISQKGNKTIRFVINSDYMEIKDGNSDTKKVALDAPATIIDGRTLVPARAVAESFGCGVSWDGNTRTVQINTDGSVAKPEPEKEGKWVVTKETHYSSDGSAAGFYKFEHDSAGNKTKSTYYGSDGNAFSWEKYEYDSKGNMTKATTYDSNGNVSSLNKYNYDSAGHMVKNERYYGGNLSEWSEYEYDSKGNIKKEKCYGPDGSLWLWVEYGYDSKGNETEWTSYDFDGTVANFGFYEYEYDSNGNAVKSTELRWGEYTKYEYTYIQQ